MTKKLDRRTAYTRMVIKESLYKLIVGKETSIRNYRERIVCASRYQSNHFLSELYGYL